jgi:hypothetical protein
VKVTGQENAVLSAFLKQSAMDSNDLEKQSGYTAAAAIRILRILKQGSNEGPKYDGRFATAICMPGRRGNGSYSVRIVDERKNPA